MALLKEVICEPDSLDLKFKAAYHKVSMVIIHKDRVTKTKAVVSVYKDKKSRDDGMKAIPNHEQGYEVEIDITDILDQIYAQLKLNPDFASATDA